MNAEIPWNRFIKGSTATGGRARASLRVSIHRIRGSAAPCWISGVVTCKAGSFFFLEIIFFYQFAF